MDGSGTGGTGDIVLTSLVASYEVRVVFVGPDLVSLEYDGTINGPVIGAALVEGCCWDTSPTVIEEQMKAVDGPFDPTIYWL